MALLRWLHRYLGLVAAVLLLLLGLTGSVLVFKDEIWQLRFAELRAPLQDLTATDHATAFAAIERRYGERLGMVRVPRPGLPAYHVYLEGGQALWRQDGAGPFHEWAWYQTPLGILTELHIHLAAGKAGSLVLGYLGFVAAFMAITGIVLWWPFRRRFRVRNLVPAGLGRGALLRTHRDLGVPAAALILLFSLTASAVIFTQPTQALLNRLLGTVGAAPAPPSLPVEAPVPAPDAATVERVAARLPQARVISWSPPAPGDGVHYFRLRQPGEVHPYGRSTVRVDGRDGQVVHVFDATQAPAGDRVSYWMYPLHAARWFGLPYRMLALLAGLALSVISLTGIVCFVRGVGRRNRREPGFRRGGHSPASRHRDYQPSVSPPSNQSHRK